ncbi:MAG TPA: cation-transporting P-type ATPase, partial [Symbiobacteriaceae bacterium]|nr:cation-transporting P-type ATPase [Symbiobacteriaceae bacterium]
PADAAVVGATALALDESHLTGECAAALRDQPGAPLPAGSLVVRGRGAAVVTATGMDSTLGRIAGMLETDERPSPLQREMDGLGRRIARLGLWVAAGVTGLSLLRGQGLVTGLLSGVSLAISAVPEGLPAFVTLALAAGARRTAAHYGQFQNLAGVETMGAVTVLCCDKTGTLTRGEMAVREICLPGATWELSGAGYSPEGEFRRSGRPADPLSDPALRRLLKVGALCTNAGLGVDEEGRLVTRGDPTEVALLVAALKAGLRASGGEGARLLEIPFDSDRRRMSVICGDGGGPALVASKGAPEAMLPLCTHLFSGGAARKLDNRTRRSLDRAAAAMAARGLRVLAIAYRSVGASESCFEAELTFLGLVGIDDPPRPEAAPTVARCREAGIRVLMITGDHPATARAVAEAVGITGDLLTGDQIAVMSDTELRAAVSGLGVVARAAPDQKLRIVAALRAAGHTVAMTGDGVNDGPAMREADIGIAMGDRGTEVARATAGLVLEDDSLATVAAAVEQGRATRQNIGRMARYLLGSNAAEVCLMGASLLLGLPLPLLPAQLLFMNLAGDGLPAAALGSLPVSPGVMPPKSDPLGSDLRRHVLGHGLKTGLAATALYAGAVLGGRPLAQARSLAMVTLAVSQVGQLSGHPAAGVRKAGAATAALTLAAVYLPPLRGALGLAPLGAGQLALALLTSRLASRPALPPA